MEFNAKTRRAQRKTFRAEFPGIAEWRSFYNQQSNFQHVGWSGLFFSMVAIIISFVVLGTVPKQNPYFQDLSIIA
jgi:hypothetical protein